MIKKTILLFVDNETILYLIILQCLFSQTRSQATSRMPLPFMFFSSDETEGITFFIQCMLKFWHLSQGLKYLKQVFHVISNLDCALYSQAVYITSYL